MRVLVVVVLLASVLRAQEAPLGKSLRTQADEVLMAGKPADSIEIYDRWLSVVRDPNGWYRQDAVVEVYTSGEHPSSGWSGRDLSIDRKSVV